MKRSSVMKAVFKVIYDPENYEESKTIRDMMRVGEYKLVLWDLDQHLREQLKYNSELSEGEQKAYDAIRSHLYELIRGYNLVID